MPIKLSDSSSSVAHEIKGILRNQLDGHFSENDLKTWFDPLRLNYSEKDRSLTIAFPHQFFADWFSQNIKRSFESVVLSFMDDHVQLIYETSKTGSNQHNRFIGSSLEKECAFDTFLVNKKNYFPVVSAREISRQETVKYNPFVITGEQGTGKTHLVKAIANGIKANGHNGKVLYSTVDDLHAMYRSCFRNPLEARNHILGHEVLLIDELQEIKKFDYLQQELITVFNVFHDHKRQMIFCLTGKVPLLGFLEPKLKSRLEWGLIVTLKQPDLDIRIKFVQNQNQLHNLHLNKERILTLAQHFEDFRSLQGIMVKLVAYKELVRNDLSDKDCKQIIDSLKEKPLPPLSPKQIIRTVSEHFQLSPRDLESSRRHHQVVMARQTAMYLCRHMLGLSYPQIGRLFGGKDHSTALYAVKKIKQLQTTNKDIKNMLTELEDLCRATRQ